MAADDRTPAGGPEARGPASVAPAPHRPGPGRPLLLRLKRRARKLKRQVWALWLALKDPATPLAARIVIVVTVAYAVSPIDLIPDFIPILGYLDDLIILPALILLALRLIPKEVAARARREAWRHLASGDRIQGGAGKAAAAVFIGVWLALAAWIVSVII